VLYLTEIACYGLIAVHSAKPGHLDKVLAVVVMHVSFVGDGNKDNLGPCAGQVLDYALLAFVI
jgi:hypothetical protein